MSRSPTDDYLSVFRSAAEELAIRVGEVSWDDEGGHMGATRGRVVRTPGGSCSYKVILTHHGGEVTERAFVTMRDAEAFIRRNTPLPAARCTLFDRAADEELSSRSVNAVSS